MKRSVAIAFHAEKLHDDATWQYTEQFARRMGENSVQATFFVYPFRAQIAGKDITDRVRTIASMGHEIGQHTHFYAGSRIDKGEKVDDLSEQNVIHCLTRDFEKLNGMGHVPRGFTAGAWLIPPALYETLASLGFVYDCSTRFPSPKGNAQSPHNGWLRAPKYHATGHGRILCLPTSCSLGEWFKWGRRIKTEGQISYQLIYLHDYDLLSLRNRLLFSCLLNITKRQAAYPLASISQECQPGIIG
jgi:Polysaccharide deacetylase